MSFIWRHNSQFCWRIQQKSAFVRYQFSCVLYLLWFLSLWDKSLWQQAFSLFKNGYNPHAIRHSDQTKREASSLKCVASNFILKQTRSWHRVLVLDGQQNFSQICSFWEKSIAHVHNFRSVASNSCAKATVGRRAQYGLNT